MPASIPGCQQHADHSQVAIGCLCALFALLWCYGAMFRNGIMDHCMVKTATSDTFCGLVKYNNTYVRLLPRPPSLPPHPGLRTAVSSPAIPAVPRPRVAAALVSETGVVLFHRRHIHPLPWRFTWCRMRCGRSAGARGCRHSGVDFRRRCESCGAGARFVELGHE